MFNLNNLLSDIGDNWDSKVMPSLGNFIRVPNCSPDYVEYDPIESDKAIKVMVEWVEEQQVKGLTHQVVRLPGRTPLIFIDIAATQGVMGSLLMYGHYDKQPPLHGKWHGSLAPHEPVVIDDFLYGRGGADDGYAIYSSVLAVKTLQDYGLPHKRCIIIIEGSEESGSPDLLSYFQHLESQIGLPELVICLDSGCKDYDRLWLTESLRGLITGKLHIDILKQGVHSGHGSAIVPDCFFILRQLLSRIENDRGEITLDELKCEIPEYIRTGAAELATICGNGIFDEFPFVAGAGPLHPNVESAILNNTWGAALSVVGAEGFPGINAGNTIVPSAGFKLSIRIPPSVDAENAAKKLKQVLEEDSPCGAQVRCEIGTIASGWQAPPLDKRIQEILRDASVSYFGETFQRMGQGGTIPFFRTLGERFPKAQFVVLGLLGPNSNAHGPNEGLHLPTAKKLTATIVELIAKCSA
jgi:acetylornithine deacetylase/succinyl-diaminopimelate desuccinylase-like protein